MQSLYSRVLAVAVLASGLASPVLAQDEDEEETETIEDFTEDFNQVEGLFPIYTNPDDGSVFMEITADQLGQDFIYFLYTENGTPRLGHFRGNYRSNRVIQLNRRYGQIEIAAENTSFAFDEDNALSNASEANITRAPLTITDIVAESDDGNRLLINASSVLTSEDLHQVKPSSPPGAPPGQFTIGSLNGDLTQVVDARSYPENTEFIVEYVYQNGSPINGGGPDITDARSVAITVQHSFVAMPENDYQPRADDFRVGYFGERVTNLTDTSITPYQDVISRWNLVKQDPDADVSDPVEPIVWWVENTTPAEIRDVVVEGIEAWNEAFEAAGISNALEARIQPDDADWDAGDIRYNVIRWTSSPTPPFGGYGPSFTNPRTGQIIGADIMMEFVFLTNRMRAAEIFDVAGMPAWVDHAVAEFHGEEVHASHIHDPNAPGGKLCSYNDFMQSQVMSGMAMLQAQGASEIEMNRLVEEALKMVILHEVGHTLGLNHNMAASYARPLDELHSELQPTASVMDYAPVNLAHEGETQGYFDGDGPGSYDIWAVQYGYTPEEDALDDILARSTDPQLVFGNDADDMRAPGRHIDPRIMTGDLSSDPVGWAEARVALINDTLADLPNRAIRDGETYQRLYLYYMSLTGQRFSAANVASRHVGGIYNYRSEVGQDGNQTPFQPVPRALQERALRVVADSLFAPDAFAVEDEFAAQLQRQRRGFDHYGTNEDPGLHARALTQQIAVMAHLTHPNVLQRMTDARRYGGDYPVADYMDDLTGYVFDEDVAGNPNTYRQNLQVAYTNRLVSIASGEAEGFDSVARSGALAALNDIKAQVAPAWFGMESGSREARAHRAHIRTLIRNFEG